MKKCVLLTLLMMALSVTAGFAQEDEWGTITIPKDQPIHLGFSAALTGDYANYGIDQQKGVELALEDVQNTVLGFKVELQAQDDQCEGAPAMAIAEKFCADPLFVGMVGFHCSGGSIPASKTLEKNGFSMVSPASTNAQLTARGMQNVFRTCFNDSVQAEVGAQYAANTLKLKTAVVLHDNSQYGQPLGQTFQAIFESLGGKVLAFEGVTRGDKDFRPVLTKIKPMNPQIVYFGGMSAEAVLILRQMRDLGMKAVFMTDDGCASVQDYIEAAGDASDGTYVTFASPMGDAYDKWAARFKERWNAEVVAYAPQAYDAAMVILKAVEKVGKVQADGSLVIGKKALADAIRATDFDGITGKVGFTETGDSKSAVSVYIVKDKKFVPVEQAQ